MKHVVVGGELLAQASPVPLKSLPALEAPDVPHGDLVAPGRPLRQDVHLAEAHGFGQRGEVLDNQFVLQHAGAGGLGDAGRGRRVALSRLRHRHHAVRVQHPVHLGENFPLVRDVVKGVVHHDTVAGAVLQRQRVSVVGQKPRVERPVRARIVFEQPPADVQRRRGDVDRDRAAPEAVQEVRQPARSGPELDDDVPRAKPRSGDENADRDQVGGEVGRAERFVEQELPVLSSFRK